MKIRHHRTIILLTSATLGLVACGSEPAEPPKEQIIVAKPEDGVRTAGEQSGDATEDANSAPQ